MVERVPHPSDRAARAGAPSGAGRRIGHAVEVGPPVVPFSLLSRLHHDPVMLGVFAERATVQGWLDAEAALARAQAALGVIPPGHADAIASVCDVDLLDLDRLWVEAANVGYSILPLVRQVAAQLPDGLGGQVHLGATRQDIMDTGLALQLSRALDRLDHLLLEVGAACVVQVERHPATTMAARTHGQQAVPTTSGAKLAVFLDEFARHRVRPKQARPRICRLSMFGAGGTSAAYGPNTPELRGLLGQELGLEVAEVPWHVARDALAEFGFLCAAMSETCARLAREIVDLARTEIGEVREADGFHRGASSTMPQKAKPVTSEGIIGLAASASSTSSALLRAMEAGHERAAGEWRIGWDAVPRLACLAAAALGAAVSLLEGLTVDPAAMQAASTRKTETMSNLRNEPLVPERGVIHPKLACDLRYRPAGGQQQIDRVTLELVRELPVRPWLSSVVAVSHTDILSSEVSDCRGEVHPLGSAAGTWQCGVSLNAGSNFIESGDDFLDVGQWEPNCGSTETQRCR